jgi:hypothetical protein
MATPVSEVLARFEMFDEDGAPFPLDRFPGRLALRGIETEQVIRYRDTRTGNEGWASAARGSASTSAASSSTGWAAG